MTKGPSDPSTKKRSSGTKHFWMKWEFARWLTEPTLITAGNAIQGFWFNLLNRMAIEEAPTLDREAHEYALLGLCREHEVASRLHALRTHGIADVEECGGRVRVTCRSMARQMEISERRREAAQERWKRKKAGETDKPSSPGTEAAERSVGVDASPVVENLHMQTSMHRSSSSSNSSSHSRSLHTEQIHEEVSPPATAVAAQIVLAHPRARMRNWGRRDIPPEAMVAVTEAIRSDAKELGTTVEACGLAMLAQVQAIARSVPEGEWRYLKDIVEFMRLREYRVKPEHLTRGTHLGGSHASSVVYPATGGARPSPAHQRGVESRRNIAAAVARLSGRPWPAHGTVAGAVPEPGAAAGHDGPVPGGVGGDAAPLRPGRVQGCVIEGDPQPGARTVLPRAG